MGIAVAIGWWIGRWLDDRFGTTPWLMVLFVLFGVGAAFKAVIRTAQDIQRHQQSEDDPDRP
ncbi:MAG: AtpZ/AtpI family protein [Deltaproteobacteria bacterium]|nr:MAG: AtpZ/AtpI family protein [Deltaproteobacteria bacterium]